MRCAAIAFALMAVGYGTVANAVPVQMAGGNYYELITEPADWETANAAANAATFNGMNGHLVTITSAEENEFVAKQLGEFTTAWTAGSDVNLDGDFHWSAGPEAGTQFWTGGIAGSAVGYAAFPAGAEPNNFMGNEQRVEIFYWAGDWNDQFHEDRIAYIIEYEAVPEPATAGLASLAGLAMLAIRRRS